MSSARSGQSWWGRRAATVVRHPACADGSDDTGVPRAHAPILRRMSAASVAAAMMALVVSMWFVAGLVAAAPGSDPGGRVRSGGVASRTAASSSAGVAPVTCAAAVDPAEVPMMRSAAVTSSPASQRPAMTPISHALPADPPPPRTNAVPEGCSLSSADAAADSDRGAEFMVVAF